MIVAFVRHGAPRNNEKNPRLTSFGHRMSIEAGVWLKSKGFLPQSCWSTNTNRTLETAENILIGCEQTLSIQVLEMLEADMSLSQIKSIFVNEGSKKVLLFCCHQPLLESLRNNYAPDSPPIRFASALIMRYSDEGWFYIDAWPGRLSY